MEDDHTEELRQRKLGMEALFGQLPPASTAAYWQRLESTETPIEVLILCLRERLAASRQLDVNRIEELIVRRAQTTLAKWARYVIQQSSASYSSGVGDEIQQECLLSLVPRLRDSSFVFLATDFACALKRLFQNAAQLVCEQEGLRTRKGVITPERVPQRQIDRLTRPADGTEMPDPAERLADTRAERAFEQVELTADLAEIIRKLSAHDAKIIYMYFFEDKTQKEIADQLECTDRAVRYRLADIMPRLRRYYTGGEEEHHV